MKVHEAIRRSIVATLEKRVAKLEAISAPEIIVENDRRRLERARTLDVPTLIESDGSDVLEAEATKVEGKTGRGGKPYLVVESDVGRIFYFPAAKHGPFAKVER